MNKNIDQINLINMIELIKYIMFDKSKSKQIIIFCYNEQVLNNACKVRAITMVCLATQQYDTT